MPKPITRDKIIKKNSREFDARTVNQDAKPLTEGAEVVFALSEKRNHPIFQARRNRSIEGMMGSIRKITLDGKGFPTLWMVPYSPHRLPVPVATLMMEGVGFTEQMIKNLSDPKCFHHNTGIINNVLSNLCGLTLDSTKYINVAGDNIPTIDVPNGGSVEFPHRCFSLCKNAILPYADKFKLVEVANENKCVHGDFCDKISLAIKNSGAAWMAQRYSGGAAFLKSPVCGHNVIINIVEVDRGNSYYGNIDAESPTISSYKVKLTGPGWSIEAENYEDIEDYIFYASEWLLNDHVKSYTSIKKFFGDKVKIDRR